MVNAVVPILQLYNIYVRNVVVSKSVVHIVCQIPDGRRLRRCSLCSGRSVLLQEWEAVTTPFLGPLVQSSSALPALLGCRFVIGMPASWDVGLGGKCSEGGLTALCVRKPPASPAEPQTSPTNCSNFRNAMGWALSQSPGPLVLPWLLLSPRLDAHSPQPFQ